MLIGINASSALKENPTGVEEYTFQLIRHLAMIPESKEHRFILYLNPRLKSERLKELKALPENFRVKFLSFPFLWTQVRLAWEMINPEIDVLFIPVHVLPVIRPKKSVVTLHGLEYEFYPELYPFGYRQYLRWTTKYALKNAARIISVSENTKQDLMKIYGGNSAKITVIHHGAAMNHESRITNQGFGIKKHILYLGRIELKKNILGIVKSYNKLRIENPGFKNKLVLAGKEGYGFPKIAEAIEGSAFKSDIILKGYISETAKNELLESASIFLFPSFYEGFGIPVLEAQSFGVPVITSNISCLPEVAGSGAIFVDPKNSDEIAEALKKVLTDEFSARKLIQAGLENVKRFSWEKCARETLKVLTE